jgi:hypothetical protein
MRNTNIHAGRGRTATRSARERQKGTHGYDHTAVTLYLEGNKQENAKVQAKQQRFFDRLVPNNLENELQALTNGETLRDAAIAVC